MVVFRTDLGRIESCRSSRVGVLSAPANTPDLPRTGDHTVESRLWAIGPDIPPGGELPAGANVLDIAPTVLALLDVPVPDSLDGRPLLGAAATTWATRRKVSSGTGARARRRCRAPSGPAVEAVPAQRAPGFLRR